MTLHSKRNFVTALAIASLVGTLFLGAPTASAAVGSKCKLSTKIDKAKCDLITVALVGKVVSLNPNFPGRTANQNYATKFLVQGQLWRVASDGKAYYDLVAEHTVSADGLKWTVTLKSDMVYSDGVTPVEAEDAAYMWDYIKALAHPIFSAVTSITATDRYTFVITLKSRFAELPFAFSSAFFMMNPRDMVKSDAKYWERPLSAGPYKIKSWTPGDDKFIITVNPFYWAKPVIKEIIFLTVPDPITRVIALKQGTIDYAFDLPIAIARGALAAKRTFRLIPVQIQGTFTLTFNLRDDTAGGKKTFPWHDVRVRQALSYAIDRQQFGDIAFFGAVKPACAILWATNPLSQCAKPGGIVQDLVEAKSLLSKTSWPNGFDITMSVLNRPGWVDAMSLIAADWKRIGVNATVVAQTDAVGVASWGTGDYQVLLGGGVGQIPTLQFGVYIGSTGALKGWSNSTSNDTLLNAVAAATSDEVKKTLIYQIEKAIWDESAHIPVGQRAVVGATRLPANIFQNVPGNDNYYVKQTPPLK